MECHFVKTLSLTGLNNMIDAKVSGPKVIPPSFSIKLIELGSELLWRLVVFDLVHAVVVLLINLVHVFPTNFNILKHYIVLLESLIKKFLSGFVLWIIELLLLLKFELSSSFYPILGDLV